MMGKDGREETSLWLHILHGHHATWQGGGGRQGGSGTDAGKVAGVLKPVNKAPALTSNSLYTVPLIRCTNCHPVQTDNPLFVRI